eukprot:TRINITY_DN4989_c0_g1_i2.p1 TRINITY_DN4989_c0_g1~~TRINITY_DN4989_c0_g1_i2.p1  ORF type:complete len:199 (+),score=36.16 TRINITY_DN4989_c0_g1_i2:900-1496(+)
MMVLEGLHRVPIIDRTGNITGIVTESMLIDFMWQNIEKFGDYFSKTKISDLIRCEMVYSTYEGTRAILAFRLMVTMNVSGLAVLDKDNHLVDNLSLRDLKRTQADASMFWNLWESVKNYKEKIAKDAPRTVAMKQTGRENPAFVLPTDSLYSVVEKMALYHIHRLYEVESVMSMKPIGVVSQSDILSSVLRKWYEKEK